MGHPEFGHKTIGKAIEMLSQIFQKWIKSHVLKVDSLSQCFRRKGKNMKKKMKVKKAVSSRFKVTKTGKVMFSHQNAGHLKQIKVKPKKEEQKNRVN